jgi:hypothetical protein
MLGQDRAPAAGQLGRRRGAGCPRGPRRAGRRRRAARERTGRRGATSTSTTHRAGREAAAPVDVGSWARHRRKVPDALRANTLHSPSPCASAVSAEPRRRSTACAARHDRAPGGAPSPSRSICAGSPGTSTRPPDRRAARGAAAGCRPGPPRRARRRAAIWSRSSARARPGRGPPKRRDGSLRRGRRRPRPRVLVDVAQDVRPLHRHAQRGRRGRVAPRRACPSTAAITRPTVPATW